jgi:DNA-binding NarL/FixJ family response regulator
MNARILIVEADGVVATDLQQQLSQLGYEVAGIAEDTEQAFEKMTSLRPDLVLMDTALKNGADGLDAAHRIRSRVDLPIVFVAGQDEEATSAEYVPRACSKRELRGAVEFALYRHAHEGRLRKMADRVLEALNYVDEPIFMADDRGNLIFINQPARQILEETGTAADPALIPRSLSTRPTNGRHLPRGMDALSRREMEVLNWFLRGFGTATIGVRLHVSPQTVRNHLKNVCRKLDVRSQVELRELFADDS